jgi:hypothetical protein
VIARYRGRVKRAREWGEIDTVRLREDRSHAEVVALLFSIGDRVAGERYLKRARAAIVSSLQA